MTSSDNKEVELGRSNSPGASVRSRRWQWFLALGAILLVLGISGVSAATFMQIASTLVFGPLLLVSSIMQLATAFLTEKRNERLLHYAAAVLEMLLGFFIIANPFQSVGALLAVVTVFFIGIGVLRLARALATRSGDRAWIVLTGLTALLVAAALWIGGPAGKLGVLGLWIAVDFLCGGVSWAALSLVERRVASGPAAVSGRQMTAH